MLIGRDLTAVGGNFCGWGYCFATRDVARVYFLSVDDIEAYLLNVLLGSLL
jgi:hypothetical protein